MFMDDTRDAAAPGLDATALDRFAESYASFNRIINRLQRQYIELKDEFAQQNQRLSETSRQLVDMTHQNLAVSEFLNSILNAVSAGIIAVDQCGRISKFNPAAGTLLNMSPETVVGRLYREVIPPGQPVIANALRAAESGTAVEGVEKQLELGDGTRLVLSVSTAVLRDNDGNRMGAVEVFQDLTRIKRIEQELSRLTTLAALGEMAATVAHEVRNPLAGIGGFASLLKRDLAEDDARQKLVDKIITGVESLNKTVTTLLNYTRFDEVNREEVKYDDFLAATLEQFQLEQSNRLRTIQVHCSIDPGSRTTILKIDPMLVRQLIFNLLHNAIEACNGDGRVAITVHRLPRAEAVRKYAERLLLGLDETVVETAVSDNGHGIAPGIIDKIFTPFFTTKSGGTGLGLAMSWKIAKAHGGEICAENDPDRGARFVLLMPAKIDTPVTEHVR